tara:strand:+ start:354 stop:485 length:132 start_codon:yes stop_codon:yes gene_type:complete
MEERGVPPSDLKGLAEELRATRRVASRGEKQPPGPAANSLDEA